MKMRAAEVVALAIVIISFVVGVHFSGAMPERMASHWNLRNEVDGYVSASWGLFLVPLFISVLFLLFLAISRIDPLRQNIETSRTYFESFIVVLFLFMFYLHLLMLLWNAGHRFVMIRLLAPAFAILFFSCGVMLEHAKQNRFVGIRTPWTLGSERVWDRTHKVGGGLFKLVGIICLLAIPFHRYATYFFLVPAILAAAYLIVYSYRAHHAEVGDGRGRKD